MFGTGLTTLQSGMKQHSICACSADGGSKPGRTLTLTLTTRCQRSLHRTEDQFNRRA